jgi:hypothetical protein
MTGAGALATVFVQPLPVPTHAVSLVWALPIGLAICLVYKAIKMESFAPRRFVREVTVSFVTGIVLLAVAAVVLLGIAELARL